jgi:peptidyl-prolyl cis-trans isomerase D
MMQQLRKSTKWIMILVALAFGGLMFFEWGMDITGQTAGSFGEIGRVNGTPVVYEEYMGTYRNLYDQLQSFQEEPVTNAQISVLEDQAWDEVVNRILIQQELERRGIRVSDREIVDAARFSPPPDLVSNPAFQTDGQFDMAKYQQFVAMAEPVVLLQLEAYYRDVIPRGKLLRQVAAGIYVSENELWNAYKDSNEKATVQYVSFDPLVRVSDDQIDITPDEISDYYSDNLEDFSVPASASVISVSFTKAPTQADTAAVGAMATELRQSILDGEDFAEVARAESTDEISAEEGGSLGVFAKGRMTPAFDSAVFAARLNRITEPVKTPFGFHLVEVTDRWGQDSAQARHILLPFERTDESEIGLLAMADSLEELGEAMALGEAVALLGLETDTLDLIETLSIIPGAGDVAEGGEWVFDTETSPGDVSPVFENSTAFYAIELVSVDPARYLTEEEAEPAIRGNIGVLKKVDAAMEEAAAMVAEIRLGRPLAEVAREIGLEVRDAGPFARDTFVPGLGRYNAAVGTAFGLDIGEVSDPVQANQNAFVIERTGSEAADSLAWAQQIDVQRIQSVNAIRQQRLNQWIDALREVARISDRREEVLTPADDEDLPQLPRVF